MRTLSLLIFIIFSSAAIAQRPYMSAVRKSHESYSEASRRSKANLPRAIKIQMSKTAETVESAAVAYADLNFKYIPELTPSAYLTQGMKLFERIRDQRNIARKTSFPRRLSWTYPQDGCFMRAEIMKNQFLEKKFSVKKAFIFGNLNVKTPFSSSGSVSWWFHVAPIFRVGNKVYITDPAISPFKPITLEKWALQQTGDIKNVKIAICHEDAAFPSDSCASPRGYDRDRLTSDAKYYLKREASNLQSIGYDFQKELGDHPYWRRLDGLILPTKLKRYFQQLQMR